MISLTDNRKMLGYELLSAYPNISHFVTIRHGGYSEGAYASFNCSPFSGDDLERVEKNQMLLLQSLSCVPEHLIIPFQTHGTKILSIDDSFLGVCGRQQQEMLNGIDALITTHPRCCICISTADCIPVLLYDRAHHVVAAIHAGWRGTVEHIVRLTLEKMRAVYGTEGKEVVGCIGPGISLQSFEVGDEVYEAFRLNGFDMKRISFRHSVTHKYHIDLWEANRQQLLDFGVSEAQIEMADICTYIRHEDFFSARRLGIKSGRILSGIMINS